jgi:pyruvate-formate lyase-activating enzyme
LDPNPTAPAAPAAAAAAAPHPTAKLRAFLRKSGVPVGPVVIADGRLLVRIALAPPGAGGGAGAGTATAPEGGRPPRWLELVLGPPGPYPPPRVIGGFALSYSGVPALDDLQQTWVDLVAALLARSPEKLPALLSRAGAAGTETLALGEALPLEFPFCTLEVADDADGSGARMELLVRTTIRCNQDCPFCSAPPPLPDPPLADLRRLLDRIHGSGLRGLVTLTGGEPTLRRDLPELVRHALSGPTDQDVQLQTNAVFFQAPERVAAYPVHPRLKFFVSLHAVDEAIYDACTATRGQLPRALAGIRNLLAAGHDLLLNCVLNRLNVDHVQDWIEAIPRLFPQGSPLLHFSVTMCPEHRPGAPDLLVPYRELGPKLEAAVRRADALGLRHDGLQSSTHASIPACLTSPEARQDPTHRPRLGAHETGHEDFSKLWVKAARCRGCRVDPWCLGLPRPYARRFGFDELQPL